MQKETNLIPKKTYAPKFDPKVVWVSNLSRYSFLLVLFLALLANVSAQAQLPTDFQQVPLLTGLSNATTMQFAPDGRIFILDRYGDVIIYKIDTQTSVTAGTVPVFHEFEDGLLGIAFDPAFLTNDYIYLHYSVIGQDKNRVSRFTMKGDVLDLNSEVILLDWGTQRIVSFHSGGDMGFDSQGNLYIATGDNSNHGNYSRMSETDVTLTAEKSSSNTNDLRGKILRITPQPNGTYTIPSGNLFPVGTSNTRPEIYVMGARNPYRIFVDKENTDWLFWGEVGPDANAPNPALGPEGLDEMNLVKQAGNFGWPYFSGADNDAYSVSYRTPSPFFNSPAAPENISTWNTGIVNLPPAQPAWLEFFHESHFAGPRYYHDGLLTDPQRFPIEFDELFFYYDFNDSHIWAVEMDAQGTIVTNEEFATSVFTDDKAGFIDMEFGPDGKMYILAYGAGCCPSNVGTGKLLRIDYTGIATNGPPTVMISADVTSGQLPLTVNFSSAGTSDPNGDSPLTYEWDFDGDEIVDSTAENPTHIYNTVGTFDVQLKVDDGNGGVGVQNVTIRAGNNAATFAFDSPVDGGFMDWNDDINFELTVTDQEDGSTSSGIDCNDVQVIPSLGHLNHFHDGATLNACPRVLNLDAGAHDTEGEMDIFYVLNANYTDQGGLTAFDQMILHPKRKEAEFYLEGSGVTKIANTDTSVGGSEAIRVDHGGNISFSGRNLLNINSIKYRVAAAAIGGTIEFRIDDLNGPLLATTNIPVTGSVNNWIDIESSFADPGGKHDIFFVFKNNAGQQGIFDLNFFEFIGPGVSVDNSPPEVNEVVSENATTTIVEFSEYVTKTSAEEVGNYVIDNEITIASAVLQPDNRSVLLTHSAITTGIPFNIGVANVRNISGLSVIENSYPLSIFDPIRINIGGPQVVAGGNSFIADQYFNGGSTYSRSVPIADTENDELYQTERFKNITYNIPLSIAGDYDIRLHFAELYFGVGSTSGGVGSRVFDTSIEGNTVLTDFDILGETNPATAIIKEFDNVSITDGFATIKFSSVVQNPKVSAIEILPSDTFGIAPTIVINSPSNGSDVNRTFDISFTVENWEIEEGSTHIHYYIDGVMVGPHYSYGPLNIDNLSLGSHTIRLELYEAGHIPTGTYDEVVVNVTNQTVCNSGVFPDQWQIHELQESELPYRHIYILPHDDLDGDGLKDIVAGAWWYKNPGSASGSWVQNTVGSPLNNIVHVHDFDGDGDMDLFGTQGTYTGFDLAWAENDGSGNFTVRTNIPSGTTSYSEPLISGIAGGIYQSNGLYQMAINWNGAESTGSPVQMLTVPNDPRNTQWTLEDISSDSLGEDIKKADIDGDGDLDLFQSSNWLRNEGNGSWTTISTGISYVSNPDRTQLADFDGDGDLDAVIGQLSIGTSDPAKNEFAWFEAPADPTQNWIKHILATDIEGSLSLFTSDIDFDGDQDIIVGEWKGGNRLIAFQNDLCNSGTWIRKTIDAGGTGFDHHDGAQVVDIDNDGDLDVVSIGWDNIVPRIFENRAITTNSNPIADSGQDQDITLPISNISLNGSGNDPDGGAVSFLWTQLSGPNTATLTNTNTADLSASNLEEGDYVFRLTVTDDENDTAFDEVTLSVLPAVTNNFALRINAGGSEIDYNGETYVADQYFDAGRTLNRSQTGLPQPYSSIRFNRSKVMGYEIPIPDGEYTVNLHFAEVWFGATSGGSGGVGSRVFDVRLEGQIVEDDLDIFSEVGAQSILVKTHTVTVTDGVLDIDFSALDADGGTRDPIINAIEIFSNSTQIPTININPITSQSSQINDSVNIGVLASGGDPNAVFTYSISGQPSGISINQTSGLISGIVDETAATGGANNDGVHKVTVIVSKSGSTNASLTFDWIITDPECVWNDLADANIDRFEAVSQKIGDKLYVFGGLSPSFSVVPETEIYDTTNDVWTIGASMPIAVTHTAAIAVGDKIWIVGGFAGNNPGVATDAVQIYDTQTNTWAVGLSLPNPVGSLAGTLFGNKIYVVGGLLPDRMTNVEDHLVLDLDNISTGWNSMAPMPSPRNHHSYINANGILYAIGGQFGHDGSHTDTNLVHGYDPNTDEWTRVADLARPRSHFKAATTVRNGKIIIVGGAERFTEIEEVSQYDPQLNLWTELCKLPKGLEEAAAQVFGDRLIVSGGRTVGNSNSIIKKTIWLKLDPSVSQPPVVDAGADKTITLPTDFVTIAGSGSDPDGGAVSYLWSLQTGPAGAVLTGTNTPNLSAADLVAGDYIFRLTVTDDENETGFDEVTLIVQSGGGAVPLADANQDQDITLPISNISLNGSGDDPDGGAVSFLWTQRTGPGTATLTNTTTTNLTASNLVEGNYVFRFTVTDDEGDTAFDEVTVSVLPEPTTSDFALRINTGGLETDYNGETFIADTYFDTGRTLNRSQTGLPQPYSSIRFNRSKVMGYEIPIPDGEYTVNLHFAEVWFGATSGGSGGVGSRVFDVRLEGQIVEDDLDIFSEVGAQSMLVKTHTVTVTDGVLDIDFSALDADGGTRDPIINAIEILGNGSSSIAPVANAGSNQTITLPATTSAIFNGSGNDPDGGLITDYVWSQVSGEITATLSGESTADLTVTGLLEGSYVFRLTVTDDENETGFDEVTLIVQSGGGTIPLANSGQDQDITLPISNINLNGSGNDPDGGAVSFLWTQRSGPNTATLTNTNTADLSASNLEEGDYVFRLTVTDDENDTTFDEVTVSVLPEPTTGDFALRINTGGSEVYYNGDTFVSDIYFDTGRTLDRPQTGLPEPYQSFRYSRSKQMSYAIPLEDGEYTVNLYFAELWFGATGGGSGGFGSRVFDVSIENILAEDNLDVFAEAGANSMLMKSHIVTITGGVLNIDFDSRDAVGGERHPIINAIEILADNQGGSGKLAIGKKQSDNDMNLFPNQATIYVTASFDKPTEVGQILVFDMIGRLVKSYNPNEIKDGRGYTIDVSLYQQGAYIIKMADNKGVSFQKQMVVRRE